MLTENRSVNKSERLLRQACVELDRRLRTGQACHAEDLLASFPELAVNPDTAVELIYAEFVIRTELGQQPERGEWYARFPQWQERLERLFRVHEMLAEGWESDTAR